MDNGIDTVTGATTAARYIMESLVKYRTACRLAESVLRGVNTEAAKQAANEVADALAFGSPD